MNTQTPRGNTAPLEPPPHHIKNSTKHSGRVLNNILTETNLGIINEPPPHHSSSSTDILALMLCTPDL
ncbi:unnamed protein product [Boreogadus saida]